MASNAVLEKHLVCPICLDIFKSPKTLPCVHSFCKSCLHDYIIQGKTMFVDGKLCFECPVCRKQTFPVRKNVDFSKWAEDFPSNHFIVSVMEDSLAGASKIEPDDPDLKRSECKCVPCQEDGKNCYAVGFCTTCVEHMCRSCCRDHKRMKATRNHVILKNDEMPKDAEVFKKMASLSICPLHPNRELEFKCSYHKTFVCSLCLRDGHRYCSHIEPISKTKDANLSEYIVKLKVLKDTTEKIRANKMAVIAEVTAQACNMKAQHTKIIDTLKTLTDFLENPFSSELNEMIECETAKLSVNNKDASSLLNAVCEDLNVAETVLKYGSDVQIAVEIDKLSADLTKQKEELAKIQDACTIVEKSNKAIEKIQSTMDSASHAFENQFKILKLAIAGHDDEKFTMRKTDLPNGPLAKVDKQNENQSNNVIQTESRPEQKQPAEQVVKNEAAAVQNEMVVAHSGTIIARMASPTIQIGSPVVQSDGLNTRGRSTSPRSMERSLSRSESDRSQSPGPSEPSLLDCGLVQVGRHNIFLPLPDDDEDEHCYFKGSVLLPDGYMVFIDKWKNSVTLVDDDFDPVFCTGIEGTPVDIALLKDNSIAVAISKAVCIYHETIGDTLVRIKTYKTRGIINSIASFDGGNLAILYSDEDCSQDVSIQIRTWDNKTLKEISNFTNLGTDPYDLTCPRLLRSRKNNELIVAEGTELVAFSDDGHMKWYFKRPFVDDIKNIGFDSEDNIYLCDSEADKVQQIASYSYKRCRAIIRHIDRPCSVLYNPVNRTLVIGCIGDESVYVFQFQ